MSNSVTPWTVGRQAPLSMGFSRQEYWDGLSYPSLGDLPNPEIEPGSPAWQADSLPSEPPGKSRSTLEGDLIKVWSDPGPQGWELISNAESGASPQT